MTFNRRACFAKKALALVLAAGACGCLPTANREQVEVQRFDPANVAVITADEAAALRKPQDPTRTGQQFFELEMYELAVPVGAISTNAEFWKPFDETFLGIWKHDVLYKNGLRVGRAPLTELAQLLDMLQDAEAKESSLIGIRGRDFEMPMRSNAPPQDIFYFDRDGQLKARSYPAADNIFAISFRQTPRTSDHVRLALAPAIRETRERIVRGGPDGGPQFARPQTFFELGIETDLGADECLVISAADHAAQSQLVIGRAFMIEERPAQLVEKAMVIIPRLRGELQEILPPPPAR